jgi:hypothetical protein
LEQGGRSIRLIHVGGHTEATILVWLPEEKVLFAGDTVWSDQHPYMAQANSKQWLEALSYIRKLHPTTIVPGHGPLTNIESTVPLSEYIRYVRRQVRVRVRRGYTKQETASSLVKSLVPMFPVPADRRGKIESQIKQGINRVYNEYKKGSEPSRPEPDEDDDHALDAEPEENLSDEDLIESTEVEMGDDQLDLDDDVADAAADDELPDSDLDDDLDE